MKRLAPLLLCTALAAGCSSAPPPAEAVEEVASRWQLAWNAGDQAKLVALYHPDNELHRAYKTNEQARSQIETEFGKLRREWGDITSYSVGTYIERSHRHVVKLTYTNKGTVPATFGLRRRGDDWLVHGFNIDGQGEPELEQ
jgi:hypothetical protein